MSICRRLTEKEKFYTEKEKLSLCRFLDLEQEAAFSYVCG